MATLIRNASRRLGNVVGSCYGTHGSDSYDKRGKAKAMRAMDRAIIQEQLQDVGVKDTPPAPPITYRVVVSTQFIENYGAHAWDGKGECPQYWKCKGGSDFIVAEGLSEFDMLTRDAMEFVPDGISYFNDYSRQYIINVAFVPSNHLTYEERMIADFERWGQPLRTAEVESMMREVRRYMK